MRDDDCAYEMVARYAVKGPRVEIQRTLPLEFGEDLVLGMIASTKGSGDGFLGRVTTYPGGRRSFLRLSTRRLCIVRHYGFIRDRIFVIPPGAIMGIRESGPSESVDITFRGSTVLKRSPSSHGVSPICR